MQRRPKKGNAPEVAATGASSVKNPEFNQGFNMSDSKALTIGATSVRQVGGLFSLNDLHKESGARPRHRPGYFLENEQTQALVKEIETAGIPAVKTKEGRGGGTYACRELVIAYAAWISAAFHLKVIRVFLAVTAPKSETVLSALTLGDHGKKAKVSKFLVAARKRAAQHLARLDKELAEWELVEDDHKGKWLPDRQIKEISTRLDRMSNLLHPYSAQFVDILGIKRALRGLDPKMGMKNDGWIEILPLQDNPAFGAAA